MTALIGNFAHDLLTSHPALLATKAVVVLVECFLVYRIIAIVAAGRKNHWQERWVEYRALAEMLRGLRFLGYVGEYGYIQRSDNFEPSSAAWFLWYLRATIRELGLPHATLDGAYQRTHLNAVEKNVIVEQLDYHQRNSATLARMHRILFRVGDACFMTTGALLSVFLLANLLLFAGVFGGNSPIVALFKSVEVATHGPEPFVERLLLALGSPITFFAAFLPALGAAFAGIRETGDFEGFAERSAKTATALQDVKREVELAKRKLTLESTGTVLLSTAQVLTEDLSAWQSVYGRKRLNLPA
jgi:hypothetical protein